MIVPMFLASGATMKKRFAPGVGTGRVGKKRPESFADLESEKGGAVGTKVAFIDSVAAISLAA